MFNCYDNCDDDENDENDNYYDNDHHQGSRNEHPVTDVDLHDDIKCKHINDYNDFCEDELSDTNINNDCRRCNNLKGKK